MSGSLHRTEHSGGKNGHGFYGPRAIAKYWSNKVRRRRDRYSTVVPDGWVKTGPTTVPERHR